MTDDDLDRALFALPLATPPAGLRERIVMLSRDLTPLRETMPARALVLGAGDITAVAVVLALATWLVLSGVAAHAIAALGVVFESAESLVQHGGNESTLLVWLAVGAAIAVVATYGPRFDLPLRRS